MKNFDINTTSFDGLFLIVRRKFSDNRGFLEKIYSEDIFNYLGIAIDDAYITTSQRNVVRGLHHQSAPFGQTKIVTCVSGNMIDLALDVRPDSRTFGKLFTYSLTANDCLSIVIPAGFSHGTISKSPNSMCLTLCGGAYLPQYEVGYHVDSWRHSSQLEGIDFDSLIYSEKDLKLPYFFT